MNFHPKLWRGAALAVACTASALSAFSSAAESAAAGDVSLSELGKFDLETLLNLEVTSASKKEEKLSQSATAIYVITQDDIRRSGFTTLPEVFRMVPGMDVARVNASQWAISARGFNDPYANKLLVLVDGRTIYTPSFGGVFWVDQDLVLQDLDRIEVIRGPGATLWGANAVNGVINILTKKAKDTQGLLLSSSYGTLEEPSTSLRYGGKLADGLYYRISGKYFNHENFETLAGGDAGDDWQMGTASLRLDWEPGEQNLFALDSGYYNGVVGERYETPVWFPPYLADRVSDNHNKGGHVLGRWTHTSSPDSQFTLQAFYDQVLHREFGVEVRQDTFDVELQHRRKLGERQEVVWGSGYRFLPDELRDSESIHWDDHRTEHQLFNFFAQDEITLVEDTLKFTLGSKFEHNDYTGLEIQPAARLAYTPDSRQTVWSSVSRAVRTPTRADTSLRGDFFTVPGPGGLPLLLQSNGSHELDSEEVIALELGYRVRPANQFSIDIAAFYNILNDFRRYEPGAPYFDPAPVPHLVVPGTAAGGYHGASYGADLSLQWAPLDHLRLEAGYSWIGFDLQPDNTPADSTPQHQLHLRSFLDLPHSIQLMGAAYYVDEITPNNGLQEVEIPAYLRLDAGISWRPVKSLEIGVWGQNLLDPVHPEFISYRTRAITEVPRSVVGRITWSY